MDVRWLSGNEIIVSYNYTVYENVSGNYCPIPSRIWINDTQRQLTILTGKYTDAQNAVT